MRLATGFVGRGELFADLQRFQDTHQNGYVRLTADAGVGKTAIAAKVARRFSAEAFFVSAIRNLTTAKQCLDHLCVALIARYSLPYDHLPAGAEDSSFFSRILSLSVAAANGPLWLVVDGLDEALGSDAWVNVLLLPPRLPPGAFILVTQRPGWYLLRTDPDTPVRDYVLAADSPTQRADLREFLAAQADRPQIAARRTATVPPVGKDAFVDGFLDASQGNFMFVRFLLADIAEGSRALDSAGLAALPHGLSGYYGEMWQRMEEIAHRDGPDQWDLVYRPITGFLAAAGEPVSAEWLASLLQTPPSNIRRGALRAWRRFVVATGEPGQERWRLVHRSFRDFLVTLDELDMPDLHARIADYFADPSRWTAFDGYASRHQVEHLGGSGDVAAALALVRSREWYVRQLETDPSGSLFRADVNAAWSAATAADADEAGQGLPAHWLGDEIWMALYADTFMGFLRSIRPRILRCLIEAGMLSDAQALALLDRDPRATGRGMAIVWLADLLRPELINEALRIALTVLSWDARTPALLELAKRLPAEAASEVLQAEVHSVLVHAEENSETADDLAELTEALPEVDLQSELSRAIAAATEDNEDDRRADRLASLAAGLGRYPALLDQAATAFRQSLDLAQWLEPYIQVLASMPPDGRGEWVAEALNLARAINDPGRKAASLVALTVLADPGISGAIGAEALAACRDIADADTRLEQLTILLQADSDSGYRDWALDAACEAARQIAEPVARAGAFGKIIPVSPDSRLDELIADAVAGLSDAEPADRITALMLVAEDLAEGPRRDRLFDQALAAARGLTNDLTRAGVLMHVAAHMPVENARPVALEAARIPGGLLAIGQMQPDNIDRSLLLAALAQSMDPANRVEVTEFALSLIDAGDRPYDRARALAALVPVLSGPRREAAVEEVRGLLGELDNPAEQAELGITMLKVIPDPARDELFERTVGFARDIQPGYLSVTVTVDAESLVTTSESMSPLMGEKTEALAALAEIDDQPLRRQSLLDEAFDAIYDLPPGMQIGAVLEIAPALTLHQCQQLLSDYDLILRDPRRQALIEGIESTEAESSGASQDEAYGQALNGPAEETDPGDYTVDGLDGSDDGQEISVTVNRWSELKDLYGFSRRPEQIAIDFEIDTETGLDRSDYQEIGKAAISGLARNLVTAGDPHVFDVPAQAHAFRTGPDWPRAIGAVLKRVAELTSGEQALDTAFSIWPDSLPPVVAASLAHYQPTSERVAFIGEALRAAKEMTDPVNLLVSLMALIRVASAPHRTEAENALRGAIAESQAGLSHDERLAKYLLRSPQSNTIAPPLRLQLVQQLIHDTWNRQEQLQNLLQMLPTVLELGGPRTTETIMAAIRDVSSRWPHSAQ